jgi:alpha-1,3-fucosyltransferase
MSNPGPPKSTQHAQTSGIQENHAAGKTRLVAWFVSNCRTHSLRELYVKQLQKHIPVDIYGACGSLKCPRNVGKSNANACNLQLEKHYKFYLSFENSLCTEYLTEKVANMMHLTVVPVVLGGAKYSDYLPPHSYITVRNFTSPGKLAEYLKMLDRNDTLYNSYFDWKGEYQQVHKHDWQKYKHIHRHGGNKYQQVHRQSPTCQICQYLHEHQGEHRVIKRMDLFWNKYKDCYSPRRFYKGIADIKG